MGFDWRRVHLENQHSRWRKREGDRPALGPVSIVGSHRRRIPQQQAVFGGQMRLRVSKMLGQQGIQRFIVRHKIGARRFVRPLPPV